MNNTELNVYTENIHLRNKFCDIYRVIKDSGFIRVDDTPSSFGLGQSVIMEIFKIAKKEKEIERVIRKKA